ncbi:MAG: hypothetical protein AAGA83_06545 [Cyanobacteria bacterium P01_F01_bin.116]
MVGMLAQQHSVIDNGPLNLVQDTTPVNLVDTVVKLLNQLSLQTQRLVLDFVEFLMHRHQLSEVVQPKQDELDEELASLYF